MNRRCGSPLILGDLDPIHPHTAARRAAITPPSGTKSQNIIISATGPVMIDLDLDRAGVWPRSRAVQVAVDDFAGPLGQRQRIKTALLRGYGTHPDFVH